MKRIIDVPLWDRIASDYQVSRDDPSRDDASGAEAGRAEASKALVPLSRIDTAASPSGVRCRASADFLAHLIAMKAKAPQTCLRRRAEPNVAAAAYGAIGHWPTRSGATLSRSL